MIGFSRPSSSRLKRRFLGNIPESLGGLTFAGTLDLFAILLLPRELKLIPDAVTILFQRRRANRYFFAIRILTVTVAALMSDSAAIHAMDRSGAPHTF